MREDRKERLQRKSRKPQGVMSISLPWKWWWFQGSLYMFAPAYQTVQFKLEYLLHTNYISMCYVLSCWVVSNSLRSVICHRVGHDRVTKCTAHWNNSLQRVGLQPARLPCPWVFSRQEYWGGLPCPPPGDTPNPEIEPRSPAMQADSLLTEPQGKPNKVALKEKGKQWS